MEIEDKLVSSYKRDIANELDRYQALRDLDVFVLDNSLRESAVGQLRGHTLKCKWDVYKEIKKCGFRNIIVASFSHMTQVDDMFVKELIDAGENVEGLFAFSEITESIKNKVPDTVTVPIGLRKLHKFGLLNVIFEKDLADSEYDFKIFSVDDMCILLLRWITWTYNNLNKKAKILVNFRDLPEVMAAHAGRVFQIVKFLACVSAKLDTPLFGVLFEELKGNSLPEEISVWFRYIRKVMDDNQWKAHLLIHVHEKYGYAEVTAIQGLMHGCNGIWASVCHEGGTIGSAASCVTLLNLIRIGNQKVLERYNCTYLRQAAINVTKTATGTEPYFRQPIYGPRALDFVYGMNKEECDLAEFFGEQAPIRITTIATPEMILAKLIRLFGENYHFTLGQADKMLKIINDDLKNNRKEEYMSKGALAWLLYRSGGTLTRSMTAIIAKETEKCHFVATSVRTQCRIIN